jgi:hypothetical protein
MTGSHPVHELDYNETGNSNITRDPLFEHEPLPHGFLRATNCTPSHGLPIEPWGRKFRKCTAKTSGQSSGVSSWFLPQSYISTLTSWQMKYQKAHVYPKGKEITDSLPKLWWGEPPLLRKFNELSKSVRKARVFKQTRIHLIAEQNSARNVKESPSSFPRKGKEEAVRLPSLNQLTNRRG